MDSIYFFIVVAVISLVIVVNLKLNLFFYLIILACIILIFQKSSLDTLKNTNARLSAELQKIKEEFNSEHSKLDEYKQSIDVYKQKTLEAFNYRRAQLDEYKQNIDVYKQKTDMEINDARAQLKADSDLLMLKVKDIPVLSAYFTQRENLKDNSVEKYLREKKRPAYKAAEEVKIIRQEKQDLLSALKTAEFKLIYYENLYPWIVEDDDAYINPSNTVNVYNKDYNPDDKNSDNIRFWLTDSEYRTLSSSEKNQLALDRYCNRPKSNSEIGRDFERYIGYIYELKGYTVQYRGIIDGFEDKGRDLICKKSGTHLVIQCKYWSSKKEIHENHITQLYGTTVKYFLEQFPHKDITAFYDALEKGSLVPILITSTTCSETAKDFAKCLGIKILENKRLDKYPMIKCNISRHSNEKIYHLPFDQQYDRVIIEKDKGEFFAMTVEEAERAGFRRAFRHFQYPVT